MGEGKGECKAAEEGEGVCLGTDRSAREQGRGESEGEGEAARHGENIGEEGEER